MVYYIQIISKKNSEKWRESEGNMNQSQTTSSSPDCLLEVYGATTFVKVYQCLNIDKIKFSFADKDKPKEGIDCYVDAEDFVADLIPLITAHKGTLSDGNLVERVVAEKRRMENEKLQYGNNVWESRPGKGQNNTLKKFGIQPGNKTQMVFNATESPEEKGSKGKRIIVGFDFKELKLLALRWSFLYEDYKRVLAERYNMASMTSEFTKKKNQQQSSGNTAGSTGNKGNTRAMPHSVSSSSDIPVSESEKTSTAAKSESTQTENVQPIMTLKCKVLKSFVDLNSGNKAMQIITEDSCKLSVICQKELIASAGQSWTTFTQKCKEGAIIQLTGSLHGDRFILSKVA